MAASITVPSSALTINGDGFSISGALQLQISTLSAPITNEVFVTGVDELTGNAITTTLTHGEGAVPAPVGLAGASRSTSATAARRRSC